MLEIILGSIALSVLHAMLPGHWMPPVVLSRTERWNMRETLAITAISGFVHTLSTVAIGIAIGAAGIELSEHFELYTTLFAPIALVLIGCVYLWLHVKHRHSHTHAATDIPPTRRSKRAIVLSLCTAMFFSPCIEIETFYMQAATQGWVGIGAVSIIYVLITVLGMVTLVWLSLAGIRQLHLTWLEHTDRLITGILLILLGIISFMLEHGHEHHHEHEHVHALLTQLIRYA